MGPTKLRCVVMLKFLRLDDIFLVFAAPLLSVLSVGLIRMLLLSGTPVSSSQRLQQMRLRKVQAALLVSLVIHAEVVYVLL